MPRTLIYFSSCAIHKDGQPDPFMMQEAPWLIDHFEKVHMVSHYGVAALTAEGVGFPLIRLGMAWLRACVITPFSGDMWHEVRRMHREQRLTPINFIKLACFTQRGIQMHLWAERLLRTCQESQTTLYSCWMSFDGYAAALCKRKHPRLRFVVRGHAFDIDVERNPMNPYLMKSAIAKMADGVYLISQVAREQYMDYMRGRVNEDKVQVLAMGSGGEPIEHRRGAPLFTQGIMRVVSCAKLLPIKQVPVLVEALSGWQGGPLHWTHIGGGDELNDFRKLVEEKLDTKENIIYELLGDLSADEVNRVYERRPFDVFINTSQKEGVPVSIMEAMRYGIPVIAPSVGGIPELVTPGTGFLYDPAEGAQGVLKRLEALAALSEEETEQMHQAAWERWNEGCCSAALLPKLFPLSAN